jgi:hypothetical protein
MVVMNYGRTAAIDKPRHIRPRPLHGKRGLGVKRLGHRYSLAPREILAYGPPGRATAEIRLFLARFCDPPAQTQLRHGVQQSTRPADDSSGLACQRSLRITIA